MALGGRKGWGRGARSALNRQPSLLGTQLFSRLRCQLPGDGAGTSPGSRRGRSALPVPPASPHAAAAPLSCSVPGSERCCRPGAGAAAVPAPSEEPSLQRAPACGRGRRGRLRALLPAALRVQPESPGGRGSARTGPRCGREQLPCVKGVQGQAETSRAAACRR